MAGTSRREFLGKTATALGAIGFPCVVPSCVLGGDGTVPPSQRIVMGGIGTGGQGQRDMRNFLDCIKTCRQPIAPAETAHRSNSLCHVANICLRLGRKVTWDPQTETFPNDPEANRMLARTMRSPWQI